MNQFLVGIDAGSTLLKAVVFDRHGIEVGSGSAQVEVTSKHPNWQERDLSELWQACVDALGRACQDSGIEPHQIAALGIVGHGDGAYLVDEHGTPVRAGIMSTDTRAADFATELSQDPTGTTLLELTGTIPFAASGGPLALWLREHEPENFSSTKHFLLCKDWLRYCFTGEIATDPTDGSDAFMDLHTPTWNSTVLDVLGLPELAEKLPPIMGSRLVAGGVTQVVAELTGLQVGTPVVSGCHDVHAAALGLGAATPGSWSALLGTWSINQVMADRPIVSPVWQSRQSIFPGTWLHMATSPTSASNIDWTCRLLGVSSNDRTTPIWQETWSLLDSGAQLPDFLPFIYGHPIAPAIGGQLSDIHGGHTAAHVLASVVRGVVFNHWLHLSFLQESFGAPAFIRVTGGGSRSPQICQLLADLSGSVIEVVDINEPGALGAALLAGNAVGLIDLESSPPHTPVSGKFEPRAAGTRDRVLEEFSAYRAVAMAALGLNSGA